DVYPEIWKGKLDRTVDQLFTECEPNDPNADMRPRVAAKYTVSFARLQHPQQILVRWAYREDVDILRNHLKRLACGIPVPSANDLLKNVATTKLAPRPSIRQAVNDFAQRHFSDTTIGIHVRYTDNKLPFK